MLADPSEIIGPGGFGPEHFVGVAESMNYTINFENDPDAATVEAPETI